MKKSNKLLIIFISIGFTIFITLIVCAILGCLNNVTPTITYLKIYDVPNKLIPYNSIVTLYHLEVDSNNQCSSKEIEEIISIFMILEEEQKVNNPKYVSEVEGIRISKESEDIFELKITRYHSSITAGHWDVYKFSKISKGKYALISYNYIQS
jgi:hypothetical protein